MDLVTHPEPELVFGVVAPVGTHFDEFQHRFTSLVSQFRYQTHVVRLSEVATRFQTGSLAVELEPETGDPEFDRINRLMTLGNKLREEAQRGDFLALHAIAEIASRRPAAPVPQRDPDPIPQTVHLLRSLKHPHEVEALRRVYGPGFFLIGVHSRDDERFAYLTEWKGITEQHAKRLIDRDQSEDEQLGQQTRDTFALADVFVSADHYKQLARFLDLVFGHPFITPTPDEHAMSLAYAASLRSAQLPRQVGAVIVSDKGDLIATGANDVPCYGGGLYWPDGPQFDQRDHNFGGDSNEREIQQLVDQVAKNLVGKFPDLESTAVAQCLEGSRLADLTEYGRVVHAEMDALLTCARSGVSARGGTLYTTTFPCHNCAKHIVAAGIERVVYVEPYAKSQAQKLHSDSLSINDTTATDKVRFLPFVGVSARRYFDLFSMKLGSGLPRKRKDATGEQAEFKRTNAKPRLRMSPFSYMRRERIAIELIPEALRASRPNDAAHRDATPPKPPAEERAT